MIKINSKKITVLFFALQALTILSLIKQGKFEYVSDIFSLTVFIAILIILAWKYSLNIGAYGLGLVFLTIISHGLLGKYIGFYNTLPLFDRIQHIFGTYSFTFFTYILIRQIFTKGYVCKSREFIFITFTWYSFRDRYRDHRIFSRCSLNP